MISIIDTRGSFSLPLWTPSFRSPKYAVRLPFPRQHAAVRMEITDVQLRPVFLDQLLILRHFCNPAVTCPICVGMITETDVNVIVIVNFVEFCRNVVGDEDESKLRVFEGCGWQRWVKAPLEHKDGRTASRGHCARVQMTVGGAGREHSGLRSFNNLMKTWISLLVQRGACSYITNRPAIFSWGVRL